MGIPILGKNGLYIETGPWFWNITRLSDGNWAHSQYLKRRLSVRSCKVSKPRDLYLEFSDRYEIWQALRQQCCRCAFQISYWYDNLKFQSRGFETLRYLTKRRLFGYWDGAQFPSESHFKTIYLRTVVLYSLSGRVAYRWIKRSLEAEISGVELPNRSANSPAPQQPCCRYSCQIWERS